MTTTPLYSSLSRQQRIAAELADVLRSRPGEWVLVIEGDGYALTRKVAQWRAGRVPSLKGDEQTEVTPDAGAFDFELITCGYGTGRTQVFGRFRLHVKPIRA